MSYQVQRIAPKSSTPTSDAESSQSTTGQKDKVKRPRARAPKVRTGCETCKIRHKKCGEERPACLNCTSRGYICDGYKNVKKEEKPTAAQSIIQSIIGKSNPTWYPQGVEEEQLCFEFFRKFTAKQLSAGLHAEFWQSYVLQASLASPCVRHCVIVLGALHKDSAYEKPSNPSDASLNMSGESTFIANQHNRALQGLKELVTGDELQSTELVLGICILFIYIESLRGNFISALTHLRSGIRVTNEVMEGRRAKASATTPIPMHCVVALFAKLDSQASEILCSSPREFFTYDSPQLEPGPIPMTFDSLEEAYMNLLEQGNSFSRRFRNSSSQPGSVSHPNHWSADHYAGLIELRNQYLALQGQWEHAFEELLHSHYREPERMGTSRSIYMYHVYLKGILERFPSNDVMSFDEMFEAFERIISTAEAVVGDRARGTQGKSEGKSLLHFDSGLTRPLYWVVAKCRCPYRRRKALQLLQVMPGTDGIHSTVLTARMAAVIIKSEETMSGSDVQSAADIPREARVAMVSLLFENEVSEMNMWLWFEGGTRSEKTISLR